MERVGEKMTPEENVYPCSVWIHFMSSQFLVKRACVLRINAEKCTYIYIQNNKVILFKPISFPNELELAPHNNIYQKLGQNITTLNYSLIRVDVVASVIFSQ